MATKTKTRKSYKKSNAPKIDAYERLTNQMIKALEAGVVPWKKSWKCVGMDLPKNVVSGKTYNGINLLMLGFQSYGSNVWGTYKQWETKGGKVKPEEGKNYTSIVRWVFFDKKDDNGNLIYKANGKPEQIGWPKWYMVYNAAQVNGIELADYLPKDDEIDGNFEPIEACEDIVKNMPKCPEIRHGGDRAYYSPVSDHVGMPKQGQFDGNSEYYSTLFHELAHSTGNAKRVGRTFGERFGSEKYSKEELIAELSACFLCNHVGIDQTFDNSAAYIGSWLEKLRNDKKLIFSAASAAKKATEYILGNAKAETEVKTD